ncbi:class I SAM-dependent methyltransferase [Aeromicrobium sp.]|uniref:class I SAM-dependent methyltransferase n=1 Tax=Aeromicrobium sp. TaxID=1871063 RepID=UPI002FC8AA55
MSNDEFTPDSTLQRLYPEAAVGGFSRQDGQVEFYTRVNALIDENSRVLDFGAGRGHWAVDPMPAMSRRLRMMRGRVAEVVGTDVDPVVVTNPSLDSAQVVDIGAPLPFDDSSFDLVVADYVLEHVTAEDAKALAEDVMRVLKPGGWFAARTPNKWGMIGLGARAIPNKFHVRVLKRLQPGRKAEDVFPTRYAMNTKRDLRQQFAPHSLYVYGHKSEPQYFGRSTLAWRIASVVDHFTPSRWAPTLMIFVQKAER